MPWYCFKCDNGDPLEVSMTVSQMESTKVSDGVHKLPSGQVVRRDFQKEMRTIATNSTGWPIHSRAMGVHPSQIGEAKERAQKIGVPTEFDNKGKAIFTDRSHRKKYCEKLGYFDQDGGYGDPQPKSNAFQE